MHLWLLYTLLKILIEPNIILGNLIMILWDLIVKNLWIYSHWQWQTWYFWNWVWLDVHKIKIAAILPNFLIFCFKMLVLLLCIVDAETRPLLLSLLHFWDSAYVFITHSRLATRMHSLRCQWIFSSLDQSCIIIAIQLQGRYSDTPHITAVVYRLELISIYWLYQ